MSPSNLPVRLRTKDGRDIEDVTTRARAESAMRSLVLRAAEALFIRGVVDGLMKNSPENTKSCSGKLKWAKPWWRTNSR